MKLFIVLALATVALAQTRAQLAPFYACMTPTTSSTCWDALWQQHEGRAAARSSYRSGAPGHIRQDRSELEDLTSNFWGTGFNALMSQITDNNWTTIAEIAPQYDLTVAPFVTEDFFQTTYIEALNGPDLGLSQYGGSTGKFAFLEYILALSAVDASDHKVANPLSITAVVNGIYTIISENFSLGPSKAFPTGITLGNTWNFHVVVQDETTGLFDVLAVVQWAEYFDTVGDAAAAGNVHFGDAP